MERGRPTKYKEEYNEQAYKLCLLGATDKELADFFGVVEDTINEWKKEYEEFSVSVQKGKTIADAEVADSFHKRATGFIKEDCEEVFQYQGEVIRAKIKKYFPPDAGAALNWLKNRQKDKWRDKHDLEVNSNQIDLSKLSDEELIIYSQLQQKLNGGE
jgi:hypothetical protein